MYFVSTDRSSGKLNSLELVPTRIKKMQIADPSPGDKKWMKKLLNREGRDLNTSVFEIDDKTLGLAWS